MGLLGIPLGSPFAVLRGGYSRDFSDNSDCMKCHTVFINCTNFSGTTFNSCPAEFLMRYTPLPKSLMISPSCSEFMELRVAFHKSNSSLPRAVSLGTMSQVMYPYETEMRWYRLSLGTLAIICGVNHGGRLSLSRLSMNR